MKRENILISAHRILATHQPYATRTIMLSDLISAINTPQTFVMDRPESHAVDVGGLRLYSDGEVFQTITPCATIFKLTPDEMALVHGALKWRLTRDVVQRKMNVPRVL